MKLETNIDPMLDLEITGDQTRLQQVLNNLLSNAKKFTREGKITVTARAESRKSQNALVYFCVTDTGIGIPANKLKQVFDSFTQADTETTTKIWRNRPGISHQQIYRRKNGWRTPGGK